MNEDYRQQLLQYLGNSITDHRKNRMEEVLANRTRKITVVLEEIFQVHNANAVIRTCDCFGVQDLHVIENRNKFEGSRGVSLGADRWVSIQSFSQTEDCYSHLHANGYKIAVTSPHATRNITDLEPENEPIALVFGTELTGVTPIAEELADYTVKIPMYGFTESFNISVSAAISLAALNDKLRRRPAAEWELSEEEKNEIRLAWYRKSVKSSRKMEAKFKAAYIKENGESGTA